MDPLTALSLACNVIAVVETSLKIVSISKEAYHSKGGSVSKVNDLDVLTSDLQDANTQLTKNLGHSEQQDAPGNPNDVALHKLCRGCSDIADEMSTKLKAYQIREDHRLRDSLRVAVKSVFQEKELTSLEARLKSYQSEIGHRIVTTLPQKLDAIESQQQEGFRGLDKRNELLMEELYQNRQTIQTSIEAQTRVLNGTASQSSSHHTYQYDQIMVMLGKVLGNLAIETSEHSETATPPPASLDQTDQDELSDMSLHEAVRSGELPEVRKILRKKRVIIRAVDDNGMTALHHACQRGDHRIAEYLVRNGAHMTDQDDHGRLPLHYAVLGDHSRIVRVLLSAGAGTKIEDDDGQTPMDMAQPQSEVEYMLRYGASLSAIDGEGHIALCHFAQKDNIEVLRSLLQQGANPNKRSKWEYTAIHIAAEQARTDMIELLISFDADIEARNSKGNTALLRAARLGHVDCVRWLIEHGADLQAQSSAGFNALSEAAFHGYPKLANFVLDRGIATGVVNDRGYQPLQIAASNGHLEVVRVCLQQGFDINSYDRMGRTALYVACDCNHAIVAKFLLESGANPNVHDHGDHASIPLGRAASKGHEACVVALLMDPRTVVNLQNADGWAALHEAARFQHLHVVRLLLRSGARTELETFAGDTALDLATPSGASAVKELLVACDHAKR